MTTQDRQAAARAAQAILSIPFFHALWDDLEQAAINQCIHAHMNDDETRRNAAAEVRAIKTIRSRLEAIANEGQSSAGRKAPA